MSVSFEYRTYKRECFYNALLVALVTALISTVLIIGLTRGADIPYTDRCLSLFMLAGMIACTICICCGKLIFGIMLLFEGYEDVRLFRGRVENIRIIALYMPNKLRRRNIEDDLYTGCIITVSGRKFYILNGNRLLSQGDDIRVSYLPKSRIVLECKCFSNTDTCEKE